MSIKFLNGPLKFLKNKYLILLIGFGIWVIFIDNNSIINWRRDCRELKQQNKQKRYYKEAIMRTDEKLRELSSNKDSLERFAREQYLFHEADEDVFVVE